MNATTRRTLIDLGIGLDAVVIAAGVAAFTDGEPLFASLCFLAAVAFAAWTRRTIAALAATSFALLLMALSRDVDLRRLAVFAVTALVLRAAIELVRRSIDRPPAAHLAPPLLPRGHVVRCLSLGALPLLALVIYTNVSDVAMRSLGIPSLLQPLILLFAVAVWHARRELGLAAIASQPLTLALAAWCFVLFVSSLHAADVRLADERIVDALKNLAIFLIVASLAASWPALRRTIGVLTAAASALAIVSILQALTPVRHELLGFARIEQAHLYGGVFEARPAGPVGDPNFYAQFLLMIVPLALFAGLTDASRRRRILFLAGAAIIACGTLLTYSRGAMLALAVVSTLAAIVLRIRARHLAAAAAIAIVGLLLAPREVTGRLLTVEALMPGASDDVDSSIVKRRLLLATAMRMFDEHLIAGVGAGNFTRSFSRYSNEVGSAEEQYDPPGSRQYPHTLYLEIGAETGLLGLAAFGAAMAFALAALFRARRVLLARGERAHAGIATGLALALTSYLVTSLFLHGAFQRYLWLLLALAAAAAQLSGEIADDTEAASLDFAAEAQG